MALFAPKQEFAYGISLWLFWKRQRVSIIFLEILLHSHGFVVSVAAIGSNIRSQSCYSRIHPWRLQVDDFYVGRNIAGSGPQARRRCLGQIRVGLVKPDRFITRKQRSGSVTRNCAVSPTQ